MLVLQQEFCFGEKEGEVNWVQERRTVLLQNAWAQQGADDREEGYAFLPIQNKIKGR